MALATELAATRTLSALRAGVSGLITVPSSAERAGAFAQVHERGTGLLGDPRAGQDPADGSRAAGELCWNTAPVAQA